MPPKRSRGGRRSRHRRGQAKSQTLKQPYVAYVSYGKTVDITLADLMNNDQLFQGVPWRLRHASFEGVVISSTQSGQPTKTPPPAFLQIALNSAETSNVEAVISQRFMVTPAVPRRRTLRMRSPNVWKEDEQRKQALTSVTNLTFGSGPTTVVAVHIEAVIQFGSFTLSNPSTLPSNFGALSSSMSELSLASDTACSIEELK